MECEDIPPGFTRRKMMTPSGNQCINSSCVAIDGEIYISSLLFKARFLDFKRSSNAVFRSSIQHGPCVTNTHECSGSMLSDRHKFHCLNSCMHYMLEGSDVLW